MLTYRKPNGEWGCKGVDLRMVEPSVYGALRRLRDYERTGLNPDAFKTNKYENKYMYKVYYENKRGKQLYILCETDEEAEEMELNLEALGYSNIVRSRFSWQVLAEVRV